MRSTGNNKAKALYKNKCATSQRQKVDWRLPGAERRLGSYCLMGTVSVWDDDKTLEMESGDGCTTP